MCVTLLLKHYTKIFYNRLLYIRNKCNTEDAKGISLLIMHSYDCFPFIAVFYIEHISGQLFIWNVYSCDIVCVSFEHKKTFWEEITLFWMQSFILPLVCVFWDLCVEFWDCFQKMCLNNWEKLSYKRAVQGLGLALCVYWFIPDSYLSSYSTHSFTNLQVFVIQCQS